jgi:hypothetical protein
MLFNFRATGLSAGASERNALFKGDRVRSAISGPLLVMMGKRSLLDVPKGHP